MTSRPPRRVAVVHEWLLERAGSEQVVERMLRLFPQAELFTLIDRMPADSRAMLAGRRVHTSFLDRMPGLPGSLKYAVPLMPLAVEQFDLSGFDLVLSSSHAVAKGVIVSPDALHLCYCHSPMRYAWDLQPTYLRTEGLTRGVRGWAARWLLHRMRLWDHRSAAGVDAFAANSAFVARRILKAWRRDAVVIHPPVTLHPPVAVPREDRYVTVGRLINYKRTDLLLEAFRRMPQRRLLIVGSGPDAARLRAAAPPNVEFAGWLSDDAMRAAVAGARAFLFAAVEDFGIAPVEAMSQGTPVIALRAGGATETIAGLDDPRPTGVFFDEQTPEAIVAAVEAFEQASGRIDPRDCIERARAFSVERFDRAFDGWVQDAWSAWCRRLDRDAAEGASRVASGVDDPGAQAIRGVKAGREATGDGDGAAEGARTARAGAHTARAGARTDAQAHPSTRRLPAEAD